MIPSSLFKVCLDWNSWFHCIVAPPIFANQDSPLCASVVKFVDVYLLFIVFVEILLSQLKAFDHSSSREHSPPRIRIQKIYFEGILPLQRLIQSSL